MINKVSQSLKKPAVVEWSSSVQKQLMKLPRHIRVKFLWAQAMKKLGLNEMRRMPGFRDEALKGAREIGLFA